MYGSILLSLDKKKVKERVKERKICNEIKIIENKNDCVSIKHTQTYER